MDDHDNRTPEKISGIFDHGKNMPEEASQLPNTPVIVLFRASLTVIFLGTLQRSLAPLDLCMLPSPLHLPLQKHTSLSLILGILFLRSRKQGQ